MGEEDADLTPGEVTRLLSELGSSRDLAYEALLPVIYGELRAVAGRMLGQERSDHTLSATALVHETYLKLVQLERLDWKGRAHFFAVAAGAMRRLLIDHAVRRRAVKRGGGQERLPLDDLVLVSEDPSVDLLDLSEALERLAALDSQQASVVELRYLGGLTIDEVAEVTGVAPRTVKNHWRVAKLWLHRELG